MNALVSGMLLMGYLIASLFFFKYWRRVGDNLFLLFSLAFLTLALQRLILSMTLGQQEDGIASYVLRLFAFVLIIFGIWQKNRQAKGTS